MSRRSQIPGMMIGRDIPRSSYVVIFLGHVKIYMNICCVNAECD